VTQNILIFSHFGKHIYNKSITKLQNHLNCSIFMFFLVHIDVQRFPLKLNQLLQLLACLTKYLLLLSAAIALSVSSTAFPGFVEFFLYRPYRNDDDERLRLVTAVSPPSKHRLQQSGNRHSISGSSPPQSENNTFNFALLRKSHMDSGMLPLRKLNCTRLKKKWSRTSEGNIITSNVMFSDSP